MGCPVRKTSEDHICSGKVTLFPGTDTIYSNNSQKNTTSCGKKTMKLQFQMARLESLL